MQMWALKSILQPTNYNTNREKNTIRQARAKAGMHVHCAAMSFNVMYNTWILNTVYGQC